MLPALKKYVDADESNTGVEIDGVITKLPVPRSKSFVVIKEAVKDLRLEARLWFFRSLFSEVLEYLTKLNCEQPVAFFLYGELLQIMKNFLRRISIFIWASFVLLVFASYVRTVPPEMSEGAQKALASLPKADREKLLQLRKAIALLPDEDKEKVRQTIVAMRSMAQRQGAGFEFSFELDLSGVVVFLLLVALAIPAAIGAAALGLGYVFIFLPLSYLFSILGL
ncbi:unnamed protein product [Cyprideis torosa]|uniref:Uncharacterized protein n=1 Tax=Cyprideis torosa TaxID=163714 RepID=A0A7R8W218_9CRUS|nr:unnamed protein product [Cyprideis torosa]CAG0881505.1 unnamed protein product [Cyprideis torosa]